MVRIGVETKGITEAVARIEALGQRARDVNPVGRQVARIVNRSTEQRFERGGPGWAPHADPARSPGELLVDTGRLKASMTNQTARQTGEDELTVSSPDAPPYTGFVDKGTVSMPARTIVGLRPGEQKQIATLVEKHIVDGPKP